MFFIFCYRQLQTRYMNYLRLSSFSFIPTALCHLDDASKSNRSQTRMVLSQLAEMMRVPSAEYEAENTRLEWPSSTEGAQTPRAKTQT